MVGCETWVEDIESEVGKYVSMAVRRGFECDSEVDVATEKKRREWERLLKKGRRVVVVMSDESMSVAYIGSEGGVVSKAVSGWWGLGNEWRAGGHELGARVSRGVGKLPSMVGGLGFTCGTLVRHGCGRGHGGAHVGDGRVASQPLFGHSPNVARGEGGQAWLGHGHGLVHGTWACSRDVHGPRLTFGAMYGT
ncbi:hypothetical protein PIB30_068639 [Stylosanthes scabra]|uniref:Uncharacterized protein n=1 Tax=Stylosanthes scabra TaxID=79078 RepID=A0ABU6VLC6_9FABA|nr:hypothetical protein [Stylosanthes scabra]